LLESAYCQTETDSKKCDQIPSNVDTVVVYTNGVDTNINASMRAMRKIKDLKLAITSNPETKLSQNGGSVNLSSLSQRTTGSGDQTDSVSDRYNLKVKITGPTPNLPSGLYQDVVTITAIAK